jgi:hypothetical protein
MCVNWSRAGLAVSHPSSLQDIKSVLPLVKKKPGGSRLSSDPEEVVEYPKILYRKLLLERADDPAEE